MLNVTPLLSQFGGCAEWAKIMARWPKGLYGRPISGGIGDIVANLNAGPQLIDRNGSEYVRHKLQGEVTENEKCAKGGEFF